MTNACIQCHAHPGIVSDGIWEKKKKKKDL